MEQPLVGIIMGSDSDLEVMSEAAQTLERLGVPFEVSIVSAHRTPVQAEEYAAQAEDRGLRVIIAAAGGAAHLAGVAAAWTTLPVLGVPIRTSTMGGLDSLLSMVQMPSGVPVGVVSINGAKNAAILAAQIVALRDARVAQGLKEMKRRQADEVNAKAARLAEIGIKGYLEGMKKQ
ncbi:MAG: 5-(carboxyamino)imidazole ribonucleotide mutase [Firmicutes bacterium]|nr:5-(carboxyamino)imidazole ribonucleotide mutase [Bacillota bacterium]